MLKKPHRLRFFSCQLVLMIFFVPFCISCSENAGTIDTLFNEPDSTDIDANLDNRNRTPASNADSSGANNKVTANNRDTSTTKNPENNCPNGEHSSCNENESEELDHPVIELATRISLPWIDADGSGATHSVEILNRGKDTALMVELSGDPRLSLINAPTHLERGERALFSIAFSGSHEFAKARATLTVYADDAITTESEVFAMAGSVSALPPTSWIALSKNNHFYGTMTTIALDTAPFPHSSGTWTDNSVHVFVPDGYTPRESVDFAVHFHGHRATLQETLTSHYYREQLWASGTNLILVVPQGPVSAASGNFGKLMSSPGLNNLLNDVTAILYRNSLVESPFIGDLVLTAHSGGYLATAANLDTITDQGKVVSAHLFDGLYGHSAAFESFVRGGGIFRSNHTASGGTRSNNQSLASKLGNLATTSPTIQSLRDYSAVIWPTHASHNNATWWNLSFAESLRWATRRSRLGPRIELLAARAMHNHQEVALQWLAPADEFLSGFRILYSRDSSHWTTAKDVPATQTQTVFAWPDNEKGMFIRITPKVIDIDDAQVLSTHTFWVGPPANVLVVNGFNRILGGSLLNVTHQATGRVGQAIFETDSASHHAVLGGDIELSDYSVVVWLLGDNSVADHTLSTEAQARLTTYLNQGGKLIISGSEIAYELDHLNKGRGFIHGLGASYVADDAKALSARGTGSLSMIESFAFGGPGALYPEDFPDVLGVRNGAQKLLEYPDGRAAAVGLEGRSAVVGFPLELIEDDNALAEIMKRLIDFVSSP